MVSNTAIEKLKEQIIAAIANASDPNLKAILLLMHTQTTMIFEVITEINSKLDDVWSDEKSLSETVLNGHAKSHDEDHEWVAERREAKCEDVCTWAKNKMEAEQKDVDAERKMKFGIKEQVIAGLITALALSWLPKFFGG